MRDEVEDIVKADLELLKYVESCQAMTPLEDTERLESSFKAVDRVKATILIDASLFAMVGGEFSWTA